MNRHSLKIILILLALSSSLASQDIESLPCDPKDNMPIILGLTTRDMILKHRAVFSSSESLIKLSPETINRWKNIDRDIRIIIVFGSWCSDSHANLPGILALDKIKNTRVKIDYIGVGRSKEINSQDWPRSLPRQSLTLVPTLWIFDNIDGVWNLNGSIVENPTDRLKTMADELLDLIVD